MRFLFQIQFLFVILLFVSCSVSKTEKVEVKNELGQVIEVFEITSEDGKKNGTRKVFDEENGSLIWEESYKDDVLHGKRTLFYSNGQPQEVENYEDSILVGEVLSYSAEGKVSAKTPYINKDGESVLNGVIERYYPNGQLMEKVTVIDNKFNGTFEEYYENGQIKAKGNYTEDRFDEASEVGIIETYDSTGTLLRKLDCTFDEDKGFSTCKTIWAKE
jgi:antitoxin component YwqK of YwqJK toxin-antitoxin module